MLELLAVSGILITSICLLLMSISILIATRHVVNSDSTILGSNPIQEETLRAYREIMETVVALNREVVTMSEEEFVQQQENLAFERDSDLYDPYQEVNATYESYFHILDSDVRAAISEYLDYLATYHTGGVEVGRLLELAGGIYEAMRRDLDLPELYPD